MKKTIVISAAVIACLLTSIFGQMFEVNKGGGLVQGKYTAKADGTYVIYGFAEATGSNASVTVTIYVEDQSVATETLPFKDGSGSVKALALVDLKKDVTYSLSAKQENHNATAVRTALEVKEKKVFELKG